MADDPLAEALADLAPDVDVSTSWEATGRTIRRRRRRQVAGLVVAGCLVAVASVGVALARPDGGDIDLAIYVPPPTTAPVPDEITITCDGGIGSLSTDIVQTNPAGVRVTYSGGSAGGRLTLGPPGGGRGTAIRDLPPDATLQFSGQSASSDPMAPGTYEVLCDEAQTATHPLFEPGPPMQFEVVDPEQHYRPSYDGSCPSARRVDDTYGDNPTVDEELRRRYGDDVEIRSHGYPDAELGQRSVWRDGRMIAGVVTSGDRVVAVFRCG